MVNVRPAEAVAGGFGLAWTMLPEVSSAFANVPEEWRAAAFLIFAVTAIHGIISSDHGSQKQIS